ncbi:SH3 domain-containing protein [Bacillus sp. FJAT-27445]|uniref:SH3 domain-containing protein n=1 Tax=Bacillus sp. FJAT-27445 TaxID=1679166 RepID=UPI000743C4EE|nr:SH3 domain-containing protein [Bacillus sp. FJAT-27445]
MKKWGRWPIFKKAVVNGLTVLVFVLGLFGPFSHTEAEAAGQTGVVEIKSGMLNVRSGPGLAYKKIGALKNKASVPVSSVKNGWVQIKYGKRTGYVSDDYVRIYLPMSEAEARKIADRADDVQRVSWEKSYTKAQVYAIMEQAFTRGFVDRYFKQQFRTDGKDSSGNQLYHVIETEIWGLALYPLDWELKYEPKKPAVERYQKDGTEYLFISQYHLDEMSGNQTTTICFVKNKEGWLVYDHLVVFEK